ncbi:MAG: SPFH domain-containing protein, partial [Candidatus Micrarchaeota archaeon]|nr:SPFH domain-containing protein [Candidatus Micrarchaeota archaeon]
MVKREVVIFVSILLLIAATLSAVFVYNVPPVFVIVAAVVILALSQVSPRLVEFKEFERGVLFQFGKFKGVLGPGWVLSWPAFQSHVVVDLRTQTVDLPKQPVITRDDVEIKVDSVIYQKVVDPKKAVIEVKDFKNAMRELLRSQIRNTIGKMELEEVLERSEELGVELKNTLKPTAEEWGISVLKVEVQQIDLPQTLVEALHKRREAGEYKVKLETEAQARQLSLDILDKAASKMSSNTMAVLYMDAMKTISNGRSTKILFPMELSILAKSLTGKLNEAAFEIQK